MQDMNVWKVGEAIKGVCSTCVPKGFVFHSSAVDTHCQHEQSVMVPHMHRQVTHIDGGVSSAGTRHIVWSVLAVANDCIHWPAGRRKRWLLQQVTTCEPAQHAGYFLCLTKKWYDKGVVLNWISNVRRHTLQ
jgi:hypothetical protein